MKTKSLMTLIGLAVVLGALAYYMAQIKKTPVTPAAIGSKVLPGLDVNRADKIVITSKDGAAAIARSKGKWVVASRFNYPANFDKVADSIRALGELKVGQTVNADRSQLGALHLVAPVPAPTNAQSQTGTLVELRDENDGFLASLLIGKSFTRQPNAPAGDPMMNFGGYAEGQYVQTYDGRTFLVSRSLERLAEPVNTWLADDFVDAPMADLREISVTGAGRAPVQLARSKDGDSFTLADLRPEEGTLDQSKVNQMAGALNRLGFDEVADPGLPVKTTGLDQGVVFRAVAKDGLVYVIKIGNTLGNETFDRYFAVSVTNEPALDKPQPDEAKGETAAPDDSLTPAKKNAAERAAEINGKFANWIYTLKSYRAEPMLLTRADLIKKPEAPKTADDAAPGAPGKGSGTTGQITDVETKAAPAKSAPGTQENK